MPLNLFEKCIFEKDLNALIIYGTPPTEAIAEAWAFIHAEYIDLNEDNEAKYLMQLQKQIVLLKEKISSVEACLFYLSYIRHEGLIELLKERGYKCSFSSTDINSYTSDLQYVSNSISFDKLKLEKSENELESYMASRKNDEIDPKYFKRQLTRLSRFRKVAVIRSTEISVEEFVYMLKDYLEYIISQKKTIEHNEHKG